MRTDLAGVDVTDLGLFGQVLDHLDGPLGGIAVHGRYEYRAVVLDVDLRARLLDDAANGLAARTDNGADLGDRYLDGSHTRGILAHLGARRVYGLGHLGQDFQPGFLRLASVCSMTS